MPGRRLGKDLREGNETGKLVIRSAHRQRGPDALVEASVACCVRCISRWAMHAERRTTRDISDIGYSGS